jgi:hypothetical protein
METSDGVIKMAQSISFPHGMNPRNPRVVQGDEIMQQIECILGGKWMQVKLGRYFMIYHTPDGGTKSMVGQSTSFINAVSQATGLAITQIVPTKK